ncbi:MAG: LytR/AlgR family response regulator transcription factor [Bacteroidales bacterium]
MRVLIIEDEMPAKAQLERLIAQNFPELKVIGHASSIVSAIDWLNKNTVELIFTDVELSDGLCFDIFSRVKTKADIIFTTAYDNYAIKAFKVDGTDYLLKPIEEEEFVTSVEKSIRNQQKRAMDISIFKDLIGASARKEYKKRFSIKLGDKIFIINVEDIAYFYSEEKVTFIVSNDGKKYISDSSLDQIEQQVNPEQFYRISRGCISNINSIKSVSKHFNSRLKVTLAPDYCKDVLVSRIRVPEFMNWIGGTI